MGIFFGLLFLFFTAIHLFACFKGLRKLRSFSKGFIMASLMGFYLVNAKNPDWVFVMALVFCLLGDMLLINTKWLMYGGFAFFFGHVCYVATYVQRTQFASIAVWVYVVGALSYACIVYLMLRFLKSGLPPKYRFPSAGYLVSIAIMSYFALLQMISTSGNGGVMIWIGSLVFMLSDFFLLIRNFRPDVRFKHKPFLVMLTYISAQALIVCGTLACARGDI